MTAPVLLLALSPVAQTRLRAQWQNLRNAIGERPIVLLTAGSDLSLPDPAVEVWRDGARRGAGAFLALMRRLSWAGFDAVYDIDATFQTQIMRFCLWPRPKWHVWPFLTCGNRASNL